MIMLKSKRSLKGVKLISKFFLSLFLSYSFLTPSNKCSWGLLTLKRKIFYFFILSLSFSLTHSFHLKALFIFLLSPPPPSRLGEVKKQKQVFALHNTLLYQIYSINMFFSLSLSFSFFSPFLFCKSRRRRREEVEEEEEIKSWINFPLIKKEKKKSCAKRWKYMIPFFFSLSLSYFQRA